MPTRSCAQSRRLLRRQDSYDTPALITQEHPAPVREYAGWCLIVVAGDEHDWHLADLSQPSSGLYPFTASIDGGRGQSRFRPRR